MAAGQYSGADIILKALVDQGVDVVFGFPGGVTLPLYDRIYQQQKINHILVSHEQGAVHAAEGYARSSGKTGVVLVTSGPGATNTVTGLVDALMDSIPVVCITGQVATHLIGNDAFQEADTTGITRQATKHNYLVRHVDDLARILHEAFHVASHGRPGPVLVDIPKDVILGKAAYVPAKKVVHKSYNPRTEPDAGAISRAVDLLASAKRPIIYGGGGIINSGPRASELLGELVRLAGCPCTLTLMALGAYPASDPQFVGMPGMHGTFEANMAMYESDVMVNIGARFDDRVTGRLDGFAPGAKKIHADIDPSSINKNIAVDVAIVGDATLVLKAMLEAWKARSAAPNAAALKEWWAKIEEWRARDCLAFEMKDSVIKPQYVLRQLQKRLKGEDVYVTTDVGQHQMWAAQHLGFDAPNRWMTSGGLGTMGYGVPAAMGVQMAHPGAKVVCVTSEGSLLMNVQEMATLARYGLPVKILNLNNSVLGMIRQWQELFHGARYSESDLGRGPDFAKLAEAFGFVGLFAETPDQVDGLLDEMMALDKPVLATVRVDTEENVFPMIPAGAAHNEIQFAAETATNGDAELSLA